MMFNIEILFCKTSYNFLLFQSSLSPLSYAFPGVVTVTSLQRWYQRLWIWGLLEPPADIARVLLLPVLPVSVPLLTAGFRSLGLSHCVLAGVPSSTNASSLWPTGPVCSCGCECIISTFIPEQRSSSQDRIKVFDTVVLLQGDPSCRRSALLKDDSLLEFYYDDTRTFYDMFQRGLRIAGGDAFSTHFTELYPTFDSFLPSRARIKTESCHPSSFKDYIILCWWGKKQNSNDLQSYEGLLYSVSLRRTHKSFWGESRFWTKLNILKSISQHVIYWWIKGCSFQGFIQCLESLKNASFKKEW